MSKQINKPLALAVGAALVGGMALSASAFAMTDLASGYMVSASHAAGEAKCGADKKAAEGKCGAKAMAMMDADKDGKVSRAECAAHHDAMFTKADANKDGYVTPVEADAMMKSMHEGKCGEAKCGADKKPAGDKAKMEGKCGEGKCGGMA